jgi:hypothetical protein
MGNPGREGRLFFFEKKKQKTFVRLDPTLQHIATQE